MKKSLIMLLVLSMVMTCFSVPAAASEAAFDLIGRINNADTMYEIRTIIEESTLIDADLSDIYFPDTVYGSLIGQSFTSVAQINRRIAQVAQEERTNPKVALYCDGVRVSKPGKGVNTVKIAPVTREGIQIAAASYASVEVSPSDTEPFSVTYDKNHEDLKVYACSNGNDGNGMQTGMDVNASAWFGTDVPDGMYRITARVATDLDTSLAQAYVSSKTADFTKPVTSELVAVPCIDWFTFSDCDLGVVEITSQNRYVGVAVKGHCLRLSSITLTEIKNNREYKAGDMKTVDLKEASTTEETELSMGSLSGDELSKIIFLESMTSLTPLNAYDVFYDDKLDIYVDASAPEGGDGSKNKPFATIEQAKAYVRTLIPTMTQDIRVNIADGDYYITEPITFDENDGGKNGYDVIYSGSYGETLPIINGGVPVSGWESQGFGIYKAHVDGATEARQFYVDGYSAERARSSEYYIAEMRFENKIIAAQHFEFEDFSDKFNHSDSAADGDSVYASSWTMTNPAMEFTITVDKAGTYTPRFKMGYCSYIGSFSGTYVSIDGTRVLSNKTAGSELSGYSDTYGNLPFTMPIHSLTGSSIYLDAGEHTVNVDMDIVSGGSHYTFLLDSMDLEIIERGEVEYIPSMDDAVETVYELEDYSSKFVKEDKIASGGGTIGHAWTITNPDVTFDITVPKTDYYDIGYKVGYAHDIGSYSPIDIVIDGTIIGNNKSPGTPLDGYDYVFGTSTVGAKMHQYTKTKVMLTEGTHQLTVDIQKINGGAPYTFIADCVSIKPSTVCRGFYASGYELPDFVYPEDLELVIPILWSTHRLPVKNVIPLPEERRHIFEMDQPYYESYTSMVCEGGVQPTEGTWFYIENDISFLDEPGEFWFDKVGGDIYYYPRSEEELTGEAYIPVSEGLIRIEGSSPESKVNNLRFENLEFAYGAYNELSVTGNCDFQADCMMPYDKTGIGPSGTGLMPPSQILINYADSIAFDSCRMRNLGSGAIAMIKGVTNSSITSNEINDISGTAVIVGTWVYTSASASGEYSSDILVENNFIRRVGQELLGSPGFGVYYAKNVDILHNDLAEAPYSGITIGWGWGNSIPVNAGCGGHRIIGNRFDSTSRLMRDGGAIYTNGSFPESGVYIAENYITDSPDFAGIYMDQGASNITIENNVVENIVDGTTYNWTRGNPVNGVIKNNYVTDSKHAISGTTEITGTTVDASASWTGKAKELVDAAGIRDDLTETIAVPALPEGYKAAWDYYTPTEALGADNVLLEMENHNPGYNVGYFAGISAGKPLTPTIYTRGKYRKLLASVHNQMWYKFDFEASKAGKYRVEMRYSTGPDSESAALNGYVTIRADKKNGSNLTNVPVYCTETSTDANPSVVLGYLDLPQGANTLTFLDNEGWLSIDNIKLVYMGE